MELNERLRELRKEQGETQKQVAAAIGIGERPYQYLESGEHRPSLDTLIALADHLGVSAGLSGLAGRTGGSCQGPPSGGLGNLCSRKGLVQRDAPPIFFFGLARKENGPCTVQKKRTLLAAALHGRAKLLYGGWREMVPACLRGLANGRGGVRCRLDALIPAGVDAEVIGVQGRI